MKLEKLSIHNIASIEDCCIDFTISPLKEESIFLISGETGTGKTTIMDAICLALYNTTPRLERFNREDYSDLNFTGVNNDNSENIKKTNTTDPRQLMRRGTTEAWSELTFTGKDNNRYVAKWYVATARKKPGGAMQSVTWTWTDTTNEKTVRLKNDIKEVRESAIGLDFNQYCRTTMLAQGEFTKFLNCDNDERSKLLEQLTGTEIYSRIGGQIGMITSEKKRIHEEKKIEIEKYQLLSDEEKAEIKEQINTLVNNVKILDNENKSLLNKQQWLKDIKSLQDNIESMSRNLTEAETSLEMKKNLISDIKQWEDTIQIRSRLEEKKRQKDILQKTIIKSEDIKNSFLHLLGGNNQTTKMLGDLQLQMKNTEEYLNIMSCHENMFENHQTIYTSLTDAIQNERKASIHAKNQDTLKKQLLAYTDEYNTYYQNHESVCKAYIDKKSELNIHSEKLKEIGIDYIIRERQSLYEKNTLAKEFISNLGLYYERINDIQKKQSELEKEESSIKEYKKNTEILAKAYNDAKITLDALQTTYDKTLAGTKDWIKEVRSSLKDGDTCPLCGQVIPHLPEENFFESALQPLRQQLETSKEKADNAYRIFQSNEVALKECVKHAEKNKTERKDMEKKFNEIKLLVEQNQNQYGLKQYDHDTVSALSNDISVRNASIKELDIKIEQAGKLNTVITDIQNVISDLEKKKELLQKLLEEKKNNISNTENRIGLEQQSRQNLLSQAQEKIEKASKLISYDNWITLWEKDKNSFINTLQQDAAKFKSEKEKKSQLSIKIDNIRTEVNDALSLKAKTEELMPEYRNLHTDNNENINRLANAWAALLSDVKNNIENKAETEKSIKALDAELEKFIEIHNDLSIERLNELNSWDSETIVKWRSDLQKIQNHISEIKGQMQQLNIQLEAKEKSRPELEETDNIESIQVLLNENIEKKGKAMECIGAMNNRLQQHESNLKRVASLKEETDKAYQTWCDWNELNQLFGTRDGKTFRLVAQSYVLRDLLQRANGQLSKFTDRYELTCQPGTLTILIHDYYQSSQPRPASTLSGGESFLISLSLALGLSSLNNKGLSVDTLFIDEGFGTLSSDYLTTVMNVLEKLHEQGGKKVGIISHVELLKERIKTQIRVSHAKESKSKSIVKVISDI